jgi:pyruvate carboxylase
VGLPPLRCCELTNERLPDNAIDHFCEQAKRCGVDIFRVFDALNDADQLEVGMKAVLKAGGVAEGTMCISGDFLVSTALLSLVIR